jgi:nicotinamide mononucleotide (NMN) deamidase PncC
MSFSSDILCRVRSPLREKENAMNEELLRYLFPILIALVLINFSWAFVLTAAKGPEGPAEKAPPGTINLEWKELEAGPEGERRTIAEKIKSKTKRKV